MPLFSSVETGEKPEKEAKPHEPKKSAAKKEKKLKRHGGFQIWTELETQRNKFMVRGLYFLLLKIMCWHTVNRFEINLLKITKTYLSSPELPL